MAQRPLDGVLRYLRRVTAKQGGVPDVELLERFARFRDEAAFEVLVWRYAGLVLNVCRRLLRSEHDVDDAFQATFLALSCKAASIRRHSSVGSWLYKVAYRAALAARPRQHVALTADAESAAPADEDLLWRDLRPILDAEVQKLPEKYQTAFVLCCLQGLTHAEAATRLGCPAGTVHSRLATAKERLRNRLERRGVTLAVEGAAFDLVRRYCAAQAGTQQVQQLMTAVSTLGRHPFLGAMPPTRAAVLTQGVLNTMWLQSLKAPVVVGLILSFAGAAGVAGYRQVTGQGRGKGEGDTIVAQAPKNPQEKKKAEATPEDAGASKAPPVKDGNDDRLRMQIRVKMDLEQVLQQLDKLQREGHKAGEAYRAERLSLNRRLLEETELKKLEEEKITFEREREKEQLRGLGKMADDLQQKMDSLAVEKPQSGEEWNAKAKLLTEVRRIIIEVQRKVENEERTHRIPASIDRKSKTEETRLRLQAMDRDYERTRSQLDPRIMDLLERQSLLTAALSYAVSPEDLFGGASSGSANLRMEKKLDQVLHELSAQRQEVEKP